MRSSRSCRQLGLLCAIAAVASSCTPIRNAIRTASPHEQYAQALRAAGLAETALGRDWLAAGAHALAAPTLVDLPFHETGYFDPEQPAARAWQFAVAAGRRLVVDVEIEAEQPFRCYLDLFAITGTPPESERVASAEAASSNLAYEVERSGTFVLRLQPELLRGGRFTITERTTATLMFPIEGRDSRGLLSSFGDERDRGARHHHGIDIFAPRGTRVVAAAAGQVSSVGTNNLGGKVVWVRVPDKGQSHYYAHLDEQLVSAGTRVNAGDPIGRVGNTGNARGTAPHLHFGIYDRAQGPVDPFPFVNNRPEPLPPVVADVEALGSWRRVSSASGRLHERPAAASGSIAELPRHTVFRVDGAVGDSYRVQLPDGTVGFVRARSTEAVARPLRTARAEIPFVLSGPRLLAAPMFEVPAGTPLPVLGRFDGFLFVRTPDGRQGWIPDPAT
jgi:murein DD-endopeptidase MepM/ murein hydrolase activator NlpD